MCNSFYNIDYNFHTSCAPRITFCALLEGYVTDTQDKFQINPRFYFLQFICEVDNMQLYGLWALYMVRKNAVSFTSVQ